MTIRNLAIAALAAILLPAPALAESASSIPVKIPTYWGTSAPGGQINCPIPIPSQSTPGIASWTTGFPPLTFSPSSAGGIPPSGADFNGVLCQLSQWTRWYNSGGAVPYDGAFQTAVGGYPKGAIVASVAIPGAYWYSTVDNNTSDPDTGGGNWIGFNPSLQVPGTGVYLEYASATVIQLAPVNGGVLWINGLNYQVPSNLQLSNGGLANSTLYYVYAYISGGAVTLEASTIGHTNNATNGFQQKVGDATRTFVGDIYTNASAQFQPQGVGVISWFNQKPIALNTTGVGDFDISSETPVEITTTARQPFLTFGVGPLNVIGQTVAMFFVSGGGGSDSVVGIALIGLDADPNIGGNFVATLSATINEAQGQGPTFIATLSEGPHYITVTGQAAPGTVEFQNPTTYINVPG